jgi:murein DD-endopeptidase MepM/ murein hydrolase activator NlpD
MPFLRRAAALVAVAVTLIPAAARADDPLASAQARVEAARRAANAAAGRYEEAQTHYYVLGNDIVRTRAGISRLRALARVVEAKARARAIEAYVSDRSQGLGDLVSGRDLLDSVRRTQFLDRVNAAGDEAIDQLGAMREELGVRQGHLSRQLDEQRAVTESRRADEAKLQGALAQATAAESELRMRIAAAKKAAANRASIARAQSVLTGRNGSATSGSSGVIIGSGSWACPAPGSAFVDTFGAPRSGGRRHQGNDMMAPRGSPITAVVAGSVSYSVGGLGGNQIWLHGNDGNTYFYAHLDSYVGPPRSVSLGELIGRVGDTGNARGGPTHLHFEIHPGGGGAIDPYPTIRAHC